MPIRQTSVEIYDASVSADATGDWVELPTRIEETLLVLDATAITGTAPVFVVTVQHSVDASPTATGEIQTLVQFAPTSGTGDQQQQRDVATWETPTAWRYMRASVTTDGTSPSARLTVRLFGEAT